MKRNMHSNLLFVSSDRKIYSEIHPKLMNEVGFIAYTNCRSRITNSINPPFRNSYIITINDSITSSIKVRWMRLKVGNKKRYAN